MAKEEPIPVKPTFPLRISAYAMDKEGKEFCVFSKEKLVEDQYYFSYNTHKDEFIKELAKILRIEMTLVFPGKDEIG